MCVASQGGKKGCEMGERAKGKFTKASSTSKSVKISIKPSAPITGKSEWMRNRGGGVRGRMSQPPPIHFQISSSTVPCTLLITGQAFPCHLFTHNKRPIQTHRWNMPAAGGSRPIMALSWAYFCLPQGERRGCQTGKVGGGQRCWKCYVSHNMNASV